MSFACINVTLQYLMKYNLAPVFTKPEFEHWFTPQPGIVDSYVVEVNLCTWIYRSTSANKTFHQSLIVWVPSLCHTCLFCLSAWCTYLLCYLISRISVQVICFAQNDGSVTDFVSFYTLPSTVMHHPVHKTLKAAYSFYNVSTRTPMHDLMQDALIAAKSVRQRVT